MPATPPAPAVPGQLYDLFLDFYDQESGSLADPTALQLDITYGNSTYEFALDVPGGGPFTYMGSAQPAAGSLYRLGTGQYGFRWAVPQSLATGVYVANWVCTYSGDQFLAVEDFPVEGGGLAPLPSGDFGFWTGSLTYQPPWAIGPTVIPFGQTDVNGITWQWQKIDGWDSPQAVGSVIQRSADHGAWAAAQYAGPRILTLTVMASAPDQETRDLARALLQQAVPFGATSTDLATLLYNEPVPKQVQVRRNGGAAITEQAITLTDVIFTIPLVAPDPRKYSPLVQTDTVILAPPIVSPLTLPLGSGLPVTAPSASPPDSATVTAVNAGSFETRPSISLTGPITGPSIVNATTGQQISYSGLTLGPADVLTIDTDNRQSFVNGVFTPADPFSAWWVLQPGSTTVYASGQSPGGAALTISWSSAWM